MKLSLAIRPALLAEAYYHCLAHLDLGRDAASLYRSSYHQAAPAGPSLRRRAKGLARALRDHPDPLALHLLPLWIDEASVPRTLAWLRGAASGPVADALALPGGRSLGEGLAEVLEEEASRLEREGWSLELQRITRDAAAAEKELSSTLEPVLSVPFAALELRLHPARSLEGAGRALPELEPTRGEARRGRVALASHLPALSDLDPLLFQILHELVHLVTDPLVEGSGSGRSTREREARGFGLHLRMEHAALAGGYQLLRRARPLHLASYLRWCAPFVLPAAGPVPRETAARAGIEKPLGSWRALERVAAVDRLRAVEAILDDGLLVEEAALARLGAALRE